MDRPIYIDADPLASRPLTGIGRFTARLALSLKSKADLRFFSQGQELAPRGSVGWGADQDLGRWAKSVWRSPRRPLDDRARESTGIYGGLRPSHRVFDREISLLHDFTPVLLPHTHSARTRKTYGAFFAETLPLSDFTIANSRSTQSDARWLSDVPPDRVIVSHPGASLCVEGHLSPTPEARKPHVGLVVSTLEPRKNARFLIDWFGKSPALPPEAELWWVGPVGWLTSRRALRALGRASPRKIRFLGMVPDAELCRLYLTAGWSVYPSLYEGFGFPVLDALRHGTPVLASGNSSLVEFAGPGVTFFDPHDAATLDRAWLAMREDRPTIDVAALDRTFSWDRMAETVLSLSLANLPRRASA